MATQPYRRAGKLVLSDPAQHLVRGMNSETVRFWMDDGGIEVTTSRFVRHRFRPHTHDTFMFGLIEDGTKGFERERKLFLAPTGSVSIVNPGDLHTGYRMDGEQLRYRALYIPTNLLALAADPMNVSSTEIPGFCTGVIQDAAVFHELKRAHRAVVQAETRLTREHLLLAALRLLVKTHGSSDAGRLDLRPSHSPTEVRRAREIIEARYAEELSISEISDQVGLSPYHLMRQFSRYVGLPMHAFQLQTRIHRAKRLLARGDALGEVALSVGFADQSHFTRRFKEFVGAPPGAYQRDLRGAKRAAEASTRFEERCVSLTPLS